MIGLGSNRLTCCRRGGMSVTQAGRGGMEWLAGGRMPLWAQWWLPYSRQAGEALKAQFPTQWPTIRDYGFAHPEIVPYVNQYPVGWGNIIVGYQLCEYIESTGTQYIDTGYLVNGQGRKLVIRAKVEFSNPVQQWCAIYGIQGFELIENGSSTLSVYTRTYDVADWSTQWNTEPTGAFEIIHGVGYDIIVGNDTEWHSGYALENLTSRNMYIFRSNGGMNPHKGRCFYFTIEDDEDTKKSLYPCYNKESGVIGMYDVVNCEFRTNAGSGTFLKGSDIYYPGQSPS